MAGDGTEIGEKGGFWGRTGLEGAAGAGNAADATDPTEVGGPIQRSTMLRATDEPTPNANPSLRV